MRKAIGALLCVAVSLSIFAAPKSRSYDLKRQPKVGDSTHYEVNATFEYQGRTASMTMEQTESVTKIENDGTFQVSTSASNCKFCTNGHEQQLPDSPRNSVVYDNLGALVNIQQSTPDAEAYRKATMLDFVAPDHSVLPGEKWTRTFKADASTGMRAATSNYEFEKTERVADVEAAKVHFEYSETEGNDAISSSGYAWINPENGSIVKIEAKFKNFPMGESGRPVDGTFSMTKQ